MFNDIGFLITTYKQEVESNIIRIRQKYQHLNKCKIIVVTTSEEDIGFKKLEQKYQDIFVIEFNNAPGSSTNTTFKFNPYPNQNLNWRLKQIRWEIYGNLPKK